MRLLGWASARPSKLKRGWDAAGPRFSAMLESDGRALVSLLAASGRLSAVDLCELALANRVLSQAVAAFWETALDRPPPPASASTTPPPPPPEPPVAALALEFDAETAGKNHAASRSRRHFDVCCLCSEHTPKPIYMRPTTEGERGVCEGCLAGWRTSFPASAGPCVLQHAAAVLAPTAAHLMGVGTADEVARSVPHFNSLQARAFRGERAMRVSLRHAASWGLKKHGGPTRMRQARALAALAESARLASDAPRGQALYEALDARELDARKFRLRSALALALAGKKCVPAPLPNTVAAPEPYDFACNADASLLQAANAYAAVGRPPLASIVEAAVKDAEAKAKPGADGGCKGKGKQAAAAAAAAAAKAAEEDEEDEEDSEYSEGSSEEESDSDGDDDDDDDESGRASRRQKRRRPRAASSR
jgi:hypothetical protein